MSQANVPGQLGLGLPGVKPLTNPFARPAGAPLPPASDGDQSLDRFNPSAVPPPKVEEPPKPLTTSATKPELLKILTAADPKADLAGFATQLGNNLNAMADFTRTGPRAVPIYVTATPATLELVRDLLRRIAE